MESERLTASGTVQVTSLATALRKRWEAEGKVEINCIGSQAVNNAVKAVAVVNEQMRKAKNKVRLGITTSFERLPDQEFIQNVLKVQPILESEWPSLQALVRAGEMRTPKEMTKQTKYASAIKQRLCEEGHVRLSTMGAKGVFLAIKSVSTANDFLRKEGEMYHGTEKHLVQVPEFRFVRDTWPEDELRKVVRLVSTCVMHDFSS